MNTKTEHHAKCIEALQLIAQLGNAGSNEYQCRYAECLKQGMHPAGWRVVKDMREIAIDVVGNLPLSPVFDKRD